MTRTGTGTGTGRTVFQLPRALEAGEPPEARGLARDGVKMMVGRRSTGTLVHTKFVRLPSFSKLATWWS